MRKLGNYSENVQKHLKLLLIEKYFLRNAVCQSLNDKESNYRSASMERREQSNNAINLIISCDKDNVRKHLKNQYKVIKRNLHNLLLELLERMMENSNEEF